MNPVPEDGDPPPQEARARDAHAVPAAEVLDRGADGRLELHDGRAVVHALRVHDDLELHALGLHHALDGAQVEPDVVGVEDLELAD